MTTKNGRVTVEGEQGAMSLTIPDCLTVSQQDNQVLVAMKEKTDEANRMQGTVRQTLANIVRGVKQEWEKKLEIRGTGYQARLEGNKLVLSLGLSHQVEVEPKEEVRFEVDDNIVSVKGADKQKVGQVAYEIRSLRPPDVYVGKGIRYEGEEIKLKPGKAAKVGEEGSVGTGSE